MQWIVGILLLGCFSTPFAASFDCGKAQTLVEKAICQNPSLSALDVELAAVYQTALQSLPDKPALREQQRQWLLNTRNPCQNETCLKRAYQQRIDTLRTLMYPHLERNKEGLSLRYERCMQQTEGVDHAMRACDYEETDFQEWRMQRAYQQLRKHLDQAQTASLQEVQELWRRYRDTHCYFLLQIDHGTLAQAMASNCVMNLTKERTAELEYYFEFYFND